MSLQVTTTTGTLANARPEPTNEGGSIHRTASFSSAPEAPFETDLAAGLNLTQEVNDFVRVLADGMDCDARSALVALQHTVKVMLAQTTSPSSDRTYP
jgi:hypothetical protein